MYMPLRLKPTPVLQVLQVCVQGNCTENCNCTVQYLDLYCKSSLEWGHSRRQGEGGDTGQDCNCL